MNYACWFSYKGMCFSIPLVFFNLNCAYSGLSYVNDYFYALYEVILTTWAIAFYVYLEVDVSPFYKEVAKHSKFLAEIYKS